MIQQTSSWNVKKPAHKDMALGAYLYGSTPVFIVRANTYPDWTSDTGATDRNTPHILIELSSTKASITAVGSYSFGRRRTRPGPVVRLSTAVTPEEMIKCALIVVPEAATILRELEAQYAAAEALMERAWAYTEPLSRDAYETACIQLGVRMLTDLAIDTCNIIYGEPDYPTYRAEEIAAIYLARRRLDGLKKEHGE